MNEVLLAVSVAASVLAFFFYMEMKAARRALASYVIEDEDEINDSDDDNAELLRRFPTMLGIITTNTESIMIDTKALLDAAHRATTDSASLRELVKSVKASLDKSIADLAAAIAASDPVATAAAQKDIDDATALLNTDSGETETALAANVSPVPVSPDKAQPASDAGVVTDPAAPAA